MPSPAALHAIIFDVDGTLAETERDGHRRAFNQAFSDLGLDWHWDEVLYGDLLAVTGGKERILHFIERHSPPLPEGREPVALARDIHACKTAHFVNLVEEGAISLRPGVKRLIAEARAHNITIAIATTTTLDNVTALLRSTLGEDSPGWFAAIGAGDMVRAKKPAPDIYFYVLDKLGLLAGNCIALEDSRNGLRASLAAELPTVITVSSYTRDEDFSGAALVASDLGEPAAPARALRGKLDESGIIDVALLERILSGARQATG
jgi:beta-phosphoglucomutase-like phosphatase (HAD superfamily)